MKRKLLYPFRYAIAFGFLSLSPAISFAQTATPVTITSGFNQDIIANGVGNASASTTMGFDQHNTRALVSLDFQATTSGSTPTYGLPVNGLINSANSIGVNFQLADYSGNNALFLTPAYVGNGATSTGTLAFSKSNVSTLYLLAGATGGGNQYQSFSATVNFADGTTQASTLTISDWYDGDGYAIQGIGRINTANNNLEGSATNPRLYEVALPLDAGNQYKTITGIAFSFEGSSSAEWASEIRLSVLAVSATASPALPSTVAVAVQGDVAATITTDGGTLQLTAAVTPATETVTWTIAEGSEFATISATGLVTALANGAVTVRATLTSDTTIYDDIEVVISNQVIAVTAVDVAVADDAPATITTDGGTLQLVATVTPDDASNADVTWAISAGSDFATISEDGLIRALANGTITVTVTTEDGSFTDTIDVVITGQVVVVTSITVTVENNAEPTIVTAGGTLQLVATILPENATDTDVVWTATPVGIVTVDENGLVTAVANGTAVVTATSASGATLSTSINITVNIPVSAVESFGKNAIAVYPNPATDMVQIKSQSIIKVVSVYDSLGKEVLRSLQPTLHMGLLSSGIYMLKAEFENGNVQVAKIVKN
ncbi:Ig-like domain-containing protein [Flavobacterium psychrotrophum]|uniref:Ig-like domain-containing protein n=1 Tax=Flavobacterium psychrotrophum TaxID=2294119 RepID=UPI000E316D8F|nr:Ig-like domain-containing protein [Flavobacterium psychrotrophum]